MIKKIRAWKKKKKKKTRLGLEDAKGILGGGLRREPGGRKE